MKVYTVRERVAAALLALVFLAGSVMFTYATIIDPGFREFSWITALVGLWGGVAVFTKVATTGQSWAFFERKVNVPDSARPNEEL